MCNGLYIKWISDPLLEIALPSDVEQVARCPQKDDCQVTEMRCKKLLVKLFFRHAVMAFKIVCRCNPVPNTTCRRVLGEVLAKLWKFSGHSPLLILQADQSERDRARKNAQVVAIPPSR
jgi:hypothetical protein